MVQEKDEAKIKRLSSKGDVFIEVHNRGRGIYTSQQIGGKTVYFEWDDRYGECYDRQVICERFCTWTPVSGSDALKADFPENKDREVYAGMHLAVLLDYCEETGKKFQDRSKGQLKSAMGAAVRQGDFGKEQAARYLGMLKAAS
jgi:hypothetical protein